MQEVSGVGIELSNKQKGYYMTEFILNNNVLPPERWEYTGEYRYVKHREWYHSQGAAMIWMSSHQSPIPYFIIRRKQWVPEPREKYWYVNDIGIYSKLNEMDKCDEKHFADGNYWRTEEVAEIYDRACRALAKTIQDELQKY